MCVRSCAQADAIASNEASEGGDIDNIVERNRALDMELRTTVSHVARLRKEAGRLSALVVQMTETVSGHIHCWGDCDPCARARELVRRQDEVFVAMREEGQQMGPNSSSASPMPPHLRRICFRRAANACFDRCGHSRRWTRPRRPAWSPSVSQRLLWTALVTGKSVRKWTT